MFYSFMPGLNSCSCLGKNFRFFFIVSFLFLSNAGISFLKTLRCVPVFEKGIFPTPICFQDFRFTVPGNGILAVFPASRSCRGVTDSLAHDLQQTPDSPGSHRIASCDEKQNNGLYALSRVDRQVLVHDFHHFDVPGLLRDRFIVHLASVHAEPLGLTLNGDPADTRTNKAGPILYPPSL